MGKEGFIGSDGPEGEDIVLAEAAVAEARKLMETGVCDVLILDEVLAVGDIFFKQKCYARLDKLIAEGTTILLVTHSMVVIRQFCNRVLVLDKGRQFYYGEPVEGIRRYSQIKGIRVANLAMASPDDEVSIPTLLSHNEFSWPADEVFMPAQCPESDQARLVRFAVCNEKGDVCTDFIQGEQIYLYGEFQLKQAIGIPIPRIMITNQFNVLVHAKSPLHYKRNLPTQVHQGDYIRFYRKMALYLAPGEYVFGFVLKTIRPKEHVCLDADLFSRPKIPLWQDYKVGSFSIMPRPGEWLPKSHGGICDLPGDCDFQLVPNL
jgi:lipopolysaccharide transport system ATP-binding protein